MNARRTSRISSSSWPGPPTLDARILRSTMRLSHTFIPTLRDDPSEAEIPSHKLLLRAGLVRQEMAGVYITLPLGLRVLRQIAEIVREEMEASGAQELRMPIVL